MKPLKYGRYEVDAEIGQGAMGKVYKAHDPMVERSVAIKAIKEEILTQDRSGEYLRRFQREARAAGGLSHPNILTIYDVGENYFVMEYLEGKNLLELISQKGRLTLAEVNTIISPIVDALEYAHRRGVYHRDIKPANIMILEDGTPKLMDFGLAHLESTVMTSTGQFLGSPSYMSPEQIKGDPMSPQADLFSLAVVTYEMLTGKKPFPGDSITTVVYRVVNEDPVPPRKWVDELPPQYDDIFHRALAKKPVDRYADFSEFLTALNLKEFDEIQIPLGPEKSTVEVPGSPEAAGAAETLDIARLHDAPTELQSVGQESVSSGTERKRTKKIPAWLPLAVVLMVLVPGIVWFLSSNLGGPAVSSTDWMVETEPDGAEVWLNGRLAGLSPIELIGLPPGEHFVRLSKRGFVTTTESLEIEKGQAAGSFVIELAATHGFLFLESDPPDAAVVIDGENAGGTPVQNHLLEPGNHEIRVGKKGYQDWTMEVKAEAGEHLNLVARLGAAPSATAPKSTPKTAEQAPLELEPGPALSALAGDVLTVGPGITPPRKISGSPPRYPERARQRRLEGRVSVQFIVTEDGLPTKFEIIESAGELLDETVLKALADWKFEPATKDSVPVKVRWVIRQSFRIGR